MKMTIEAGMDRRSSQSSSSMAYSTPPTKKSDIALLDLAQRKSDNPVRIERWAAEIKGKINTFNGSVDEYIERFLPSRLRSRRMTHKVEEAFAAAITPPSGESRSTELAMYKPIVREITCLAASVA